MDKKQAAREAAKIGLRPSKLTFDLLTLKVVSESHVTWATSNQHGNPFTLTTLPLARHFPSASDLKPACSVDPLRRPKTTPIYIIYYYYAMLNSITVCLTSVLSRM